MKTISIVNPQKIKLRHIFTGVSREFNPEEMFLIFSQNKQEYIFDKNWLESFIYQNKIRSAEDFFATFKQKFGIDISLLFSKESVEELLNHLWSPANVIRFELNESTNFVALAEKIWYVNPYFYDHSKTFWLWDWRESVYKPVDETQILKIVVNVLENRDIPKRGIKERLLDALRIVGREKIPEELPPEWIQVRDKLYNIKTGEMKDVDWKYFCTNRIPWRIGESEETPTIDKLFSEWVGEENKQILYEICAYSLLRNYPIHRIFILYGSGRNGKGSFLRLLKKFVGEENTVSTELERLENSRFESAKLYKKLLCFIGETDFSVIKKSSILKALSGQDLIPAEFKNKPTFDFVNYAKLIISTNNLPMTLDTSDGFFSRMIIVDFPNVFDEGKDILEEIPDWEYENLLKKCLRILPELLDRGKFTGEGSIEEKRERYEERANPLKVFIKQFCEFDPEGYIPSTEFYHKFVSWMRTNKPRFRVPNWKTEVKPILESMGLETGVRKYVNSEQKRCIVGLKWKEDNVTLVTDVTDISTQFPNIGNRCENSVTSVTSVTNTEISEESNAPTCYFCKLPKQPLYDFAKSLGRTDKEGYACFRCAVEKLLPVPFKLLGSNKIHKSELENFPKEFIERCLREGILADFGEEVLLCERG